MAEGFLTITGVTAPISVHAGDLVNFTVHTKNTGAADNFKVELSGKLTGSTEFSLKAGLTKDVPFSFIMFDADVKIIVTTYHFEEDYPLWGYTGINYTLSETSDIYDIFFDGTYWFVLDGMNGQVYKYSRDFIYTGISYNMVGTGEEYPLSIFFYGTYWWVLKWRWDGSKYINYVHKYNQDWTYTGIKYNLPSSIIPRNIFFDGTYWWVLTNTGGGYYRYLRYKSDWTYIDGYEWLSVGQGSYVDDFFFDGTYWWASYGGIYVLKYSSDFQYLGDVGLPVSIRVIFHSGNYWYGGYGNKIYKFGG